MDAAEWDRRYAAEQLVWGAEPNRFVVELAAALLPGRAVDLACGEGRNALWLARQGWTVTAVDFSAVAVDRGRQLGEQAGLQVHWRCVDVEAEPVPEADLVLLAYLHLPAARRAAILSRAAAAVRLRIAAAGRSRPPQPARGRRRPAAAGPAVDAGRRAGSRFDRGGRPDPGAAGR